MEQLSLFDVGEYQVANVARIGFSAEQEDELKRAMARALIEICETEANRNEPDARA